MEKPRTIQSGIAINPVIGNSFIGHCCLAYLLLNSKQFHPYDFFPPNYERNKHSLLVYSVVYWPKHILAVDQGESMIEQMKKHLVLNTFPFENWVNIYNYQHSYSEGKLMDSSSLLHCAAYHGITTMVYLLLKPF